MGMTRGRTARVIAEVSLEELQWESNLYRRNQFAPLCPAGHLPHGWGDWLGAQTLPYRNVEFGRRDGR
jgi:hypothetical protein